MVRDDLYNLGTLTHSHATQRGETPFIAVMNNKLVTLPTTSPGPPQLVVLSVKSKNVTNWRPQRGAQLKEQFHPL